MSELQDRSDATSTPSDGNVDAEGVLSRLCGGATQLRESARTAALDGLQRVRDCTDQLHTDLVRAADRSTAYVRREPLKSVLIAAGVGAAVALIVQGMRNARTKR